MNDNRFTVRYQRPIFNWELLQANVYFNGVHAASYRESDVDHDAGALVAQLNSAVFHPPHARSVRAGHGSVDFANIFTVEKGKKQFDRPHPFAGVVFDDARVMFNGVCVTSFNDMACGRGRRHFDDAQVLADKLNAAVFHHQHARSIPR